MSISSSAIKDLFQTRGWTLRTGEMLDAGIHPRAICALQAAGTIERLARGLYRWAEAPEPADPDLLIVARRVPRAVVCLVSALSIHGLTTQIPHVIHLALPRPTRCPVLQHPPIEVHFFAVAMYEAGVTNIDVFGSTVRVYSPEKTLADCFRFRNRIGLDVILEALRAYRSRRGANMQGVLEFARICRVETGMRPYLEASA